MNALLDNPDMVTREMLHLGKKFPWLLESLIHERDQYMVLELEQVRVLSINRCGFYQRHARVASFISSFYRHHHLDCALCSTLLTHRENLLPQTVDELEKGDVVAVVGAAHVPGITRFWEQRQQERLSGVDTGACSSPSESARLHQRLQYHPGTQYTDATDGATRTFTKQDLR
jgi:hypothetical protein